MYVVKEEAIPSTSAQWELDYDLDEMGYYFLVDEYMEISITNQNKLYESSSFYKFKFLVIQYGFVTFFVAAFPLAPLCALINNILKIRTDASKFVKYYRRPVPIRINGLQAWNNILKWMTLISMVTNVSDTANYVHTYVIYLMTM